MKKSCIYILSAFLVLGIFTGCQNFLNGSVLKKELDEKIAYANATKVTFEMRVDNASYGTIYPASATVIKGESFEVSFTQQINALAVNWIVVDKSNSPVNNAVSYSEVLQQQEDGSVSHKLKVTATSDSVANLILKPVFTFDMPETAVPVINSVSLYGDKDGKRRMSELHPDVWSAEGNGINNATETPAIAYTKYKDTPWYKNCVSELYLSMNFSMAESDVKEIKVTETLVRNKSNYSVLNPNVYTQSISKDNLVSDGKDSYSLSMYPLDFMSKEDGMVELKISVINSYGLETRSDNVFYVIKHTKYGGEVKVSSNLSSEYDYRLPDSNGIDTIACGTLFVPISKITGSDEIYSFEDKNTGTLCFPQTVCIEYYDEGETEKHLYAKYKDPGMFSERNADNYLKLYFDSSVHNEIQDYTIKSKSDDGVVTEYVFVNQIKRNANKTTYIDVTVTSESGLSQTKTLTIEPAINIKFYLEKSNDKRIYLYTDLGREDSDFKNNYGRIYYRKKTGNNAATYSSSESNYIVLTASTEYEVYATRHTEGFGVYSCLGAPLKFKTDGSCNVKPVSSSSTVSMPSLTSASFIPGTPETNKSKVPVQVKLPEGYATPDGIKLVFLFEYTVTDNLGSSTVYSTVCEQSDIYLRSNFNHTLKAVYAQDSSGAYIYSISPSGVTVNLTDKKYDNEPPYTTGTGVTFLTYNDISKISIENMKFIKDNGSGFEKTEDGKGIIHYWIKKNKEDSVIEPITEDDLKILTEYKAYYDTGTGKGVFNMNLPEQGVYSFYSRIYDNNGNYLDSLKIKYPYDFEAKAVYYKAGGDPGYYASKQYYNANSWVSDTNTNYKKLFGWNFDNDIFSKTTYSIKSSDWSGYTCNLTNISKDLYGYTIQTDSPTLIQYMYHCTDLGDDKDFWGTFGCEQYVTQVTSSYSVKQSIIDQIPAGNYYTVLVHYMDGTVQMTPVEYKAK